MLAVWHPPVSFCLNGNQVPNCSAWELLLPFQKCFLFAESIFSLTDWVCAKASPWNSLGISSGATPCTKPAGLSSLSTRYKQVRRRLHRRWKDESGHLLKMMRNLRNFYQQQALRGFCNSADSCGLHFKSYRRFAPSKSRICLFVRFVGLLFPQLPCFLLLLLLCPVMKIEKYFLCHCC